ncbi:hypothetical protein RclHR1_03840012 [Rhizophagus clarus]|uniref:Uncharacterized protein n=1 Tax=Rhizophagus clarus TaxID=94130 RepID=A0A2Z6RTP9_9GLOM|nr:hypothetical protein RclHR1_03840012 [Rhizophagus clarus]
MMEIFFNSPSISEKNSDIDDSFDNITENEDDCNSLLAEIASINKAKELVASDTDSTDDNDSENTDWEISSILTIASKSTEVENEVEILRINSSKLTPCALVDMINRSIQRCSETKDLQRLLQLIGTWQIDSNAVSSLGNKNLLAPCIGYKSYYALQINGPIVTAAKPQQKSWYICCNCFEKNGGHLYVRLGTGKSALQCKMQENHNEDVKKSLQLIVIEQLFNSTLLSTNENSIYLSTPIILTPCEPPSFFIISSLFKLYQLEEPNSLEEYKSTLPLKLYGLLDSIVQVLFEKRREYANLRRKYRHSDNDCKPTNDDNKIQKIVVFICSITISVGYKVNAAGITRKYEQVLKIKHMELADPKLCI